VTPVPKILMIAYYFPPLGGGGVPRPLKFCKYLPEFGWDVVVLTAKNGVGPVYDKTLLDELNSYKNVKVYRTISFELGALKNLFKKIFFDNSNTKNQSAPIERQEKKYREIKTQKKGYLKRIFSKCYDLLFKLQKFLCVPDDKILWAIPSFFSALRIIKKEKPDMIFVTLPPYSSFILAVLLKKFLGVKLITDYRDPWNTEFDKKGINYLIEKWCLKNCDGYVYAVEQINQWLLKLYNIRNIQTELITNGYDEDDYKNIEPIKFDKWTMISGGDLYGEENIYFFKILEEFLSENSEIKNNFQLIICSNKQKWFEDYLKHSQIKENIINLGILPKKEYLRYVAGADCACIFTYAYYNTSNQIQLHGRVFDYLVLNKKLLVIGKEEKNNTLLNFLKMNDFNFIFSGQENKQDIKEKLYFIFRNSNNLKIENKNIEKYSRKELTKKLNEYLRNIL